MTIANGIGEGMGGAWNDRRSGRGLLRRGDRAVLMRYLRGAGLSVLLAWSLALAYLAITPLKFASRFTLILPGSAQSATMQLDTIGQATSTANSPFSSVSLSPKVVYKEIADSDQVRVAAAQATGLTYAEFGRPRIKLIDETGLMQFEMAANAPELAHRKAVALIGALNKQLDILRQDELEKRSAAITLNLKGYKDAVAYARQKITDIQVSSGLVSISQFNESVGNLGTTRRKLTDLTGEQGKLREEQAKLIARIGIDSANAGLALRLAGDPALIKMVTDFADANSQYEAETKRLGPENPVLINFDKRRQASLEQLVKRMDELGIGKQGIGRVSILMTNVSKQAELLQQMVRNEALIDGKAKEIETLTVERDRLEEEIKRLSGAAAKLEDLKKDHILAEAVYSSALARVDTSKSDIYGAYPILQVLAVPNMPQGHEQPRRLYAFAGGMIGTLFSLIAWGLAWLQHLQTIKRRKKQSSIG
ncbi:MAG: hypothetical protein ABL901_08630 [Hyphomicrobiaceae bacterium]